MLFICFTSADDRVKIDCAGPLRCEPSQPRAAKFGISLPSSLYAESLFKLRMKLHKNDRHLAGGLLPFTKPFDRIRVIMVSPGFWLESDLRPSVCQPVSQLGIFEVDLGESLVEQTRLRQQELSIDGNVRCIEVPKIYVLTWLKSIETKLLVPDFGDMGHQVVEF